MSYDQAIKHWANHRKDRYYQPCSGPVDISTNPLKQVSKEKEKNLSITSIDKIINDNPAFPIHIYQRNYGEWVVVPSNHLFGTRLNSMEELKIFAQEYVYGE